MKLPRIAVLIPVVLHLAPSSCGFGHSTLQARPEVGSLGRELGQVKLSRPGKDRTHPSNIYHSNMPTPID